MNNAPMPTDHVSLDPVSIWLATHVVDDAQHWGRLPFRFLTPDVVKETPSLGEDHDIHFECLSKSDDLEIVPIDACLGHCLHVLFISSINFFRSWSSGDGRCGESAMVLAFWVSTRAASRMDDKE